MDGTVYCKCIGLYCVNLGILLIPFDVRVQKKHLLEAFKHHPFGDSNEPIFEKNGCL